MTLLTYLKLDTTGFDAGASRAQSTIAGVGQAASAAGAAAAGSGSAR
jgi:hypothetical protein